MAIHAGFVAPFLVVGHIAMIFIDVQIRTPDGLIPSRLLQIHWRKISATPASAG